MIRSYEQRSFLADRADEDGENAYPDAVRPFPGLGVEWGGGDAEERGRGRGHHNPGDVLLGDKAGLQQF